MCNYIVFIISLCTPLIIIIGIFAAVRYISYDIESSTYSGNITEELNGKVIINYIKFKIVVYPTILYATDFKIVSSNFNQFGYTIIKEDNKILKVVNENGKILFLLERIADKVFCTHTNIKKD